MGLISGKVIIFLLALFVSFGMYAAYGFVQIKQDDYRCVFGKRWINVGGRETLWSVGSVHLNYQPKKWSCDETEKYNPKQYNNQDGQLTPVAKPGL